MRKMMGKVKLCVVVLLCLTTMAVASNVTVTNYPTSAGVTSTQIWIDVGDYDVKEPNFVDVTTALEAASGPTLSGSAYAFTAVSGGGDKQPWYAEYSIASADAPTVTLSGTWYYWARVSQPEVHDWYDSQYLFVKGDAGDGSGATWYDDALAGCDNGDDRTHNAHGISGRWGWNYSADAPLREKEFNLIDNKITFRVSERESGAKATAVDAIVWTDDPNYVPTDGDYLGTAVEQGLVLYMDASRAGDIAETNWEPVVGNAGGGELTALGESFGGVKPALMSEPDPNNVLQKNWFYRFEAGGPSPDFTGGMVNNVDPDRELNFALLGDFTLEAWVRAQNIQPGSSGRGAFIGNQQVGLRGWRFGVRENAGQYQFELVQRNDYLGGNTTMQISNTTGLLNYGSDWNHVVLLHDGDELAGSYDYSIFVNGVEESDLTKVVTMADETVVPLANACALGSTPSGTSLARYPFDGDLSIVRVYNRVLLDEEVARNYALGKSSAVTSQCGGQVADTDGDCDVDLDDFADLAAQWLENNVI